MARSKDHVWELANTVWGDFPVETLARAYAGHHQIINGIFRDKGGDTFAQEKNGLHCGIRMVYLPKYASEDPGEDEKPIRVEVYDCPDEVGGIRQLKYTTPELNEEMIERSGDYLCRAQCKVLVDELESLMEDETRDDYDDIAMRFTVFGMALDGMSTEVGHSR
jgi:hypothetical protein